MGSYFELTNLWPENYCSITITNPLPSKGITHTSVYKKACDSEFLKHYSVSRFRDGIIPDALPNNNGWLIISPKCRNLMTLPGAVANPHFEPVAGMLEDCINKFPAELLTYSLVSAKAVFDCIDLDNARVSWFDESKTLVRSFRELPLTDQNLPSGPAFFGVMRAPCLFVVSNEFRDCLIEENISGLGFKECIISRCS